MSVRYYNFYIAYLHIAKKCYKKYCVDKGIVAASPITLLQLQHQEVTKLVNQLIAEQVGVTYNTNDYYRYKSNGRFIYNFIKNIKCTPQLLRFPICWSKFYVNETKSNVIYRATQQDNNLLNQLQQLSQLCTCNVERPESSIAQCKNVLCVVGFYHLECTNYSISNTSDWYCSLCKDGMYLFNFIRMFSY